MRLCAPGLNIPFGESLCTVRTLTNACSTKSDLPRAIGYHHSRQLIVVHDDGSSVPGASSSGVGTLHGRARPKLRGTWLGASDVRPWRPRNRTFVVVDRILTIMMPSNMLSSDASPPMIDHSLDAASVHPAALCCSPQKVQPGQDVRFCGLALPAQERRTRFF